MKTAVRTAFVCFAAALLARSMMSASQKNVLDRLSGLIPESVLGWTAGAIDDLYDPETIFSYIDGAGEVYRAYNFLHLLSRRYEKKDGPEIIVDLFDMGSPSDAFGVNTMDLEGEDPGIGQGGTYKDGLLSFWRDRYFVSIMAGSETAETRAACFDFGRRIAAAIGRDGDRPALLSALPPGLARPTAVRYLHSHVVLNRHFFVHAENILNLEPGVEAVLARMGDKGRDGALLIVKYPSARAASAAFAGFMAAFPPGGADSAGTSVPAGKRGAVRLTADAFAAVLGAATDEAVRTVLDRVAEQVKKGGIG